jgi:hypothetical protein
MTEDEKQRIRILFAYVLRMLKAEAETSARVSAELASVLAAVRGLDPTFEDVLEDRRAAVDEITDPAIHADLALYDEMIRKVESGELI